MKMINKKKNKITRLLSQLRLGERNDAFLGEMFGRLSTKKIIGRLSVGLVIWLIAVGALGAAVVLPMVTDPYSGTVHIKQPTLTATVSPATASWDGSTISPGITQPLTQTIQMSITASLAACVHYTITIAGPLGAVATDFEPTAVNGHGTGGFTVTATNQGVDINQPVTTGTGFGSRFVTGAYPVVVTVDADGTVQDGAYSIVVNFVAVACA